MMETEMNEIMLSVSRFVAIPTVTFKGIKSLEFTGKSASVLKATVWKLTSEMEVLTWRVFVCQPFPFCVNFEDIKLNKTQ